MFITAAIALDAQKAVFEQSALEIVIELLAYKSREISTIGLQGGNKGRDVLFDELIQKRLLRPVPVVAKG